MGVPYEVIEDDEYGRILNETFTNKFRFGYVDIKGITLTRRYADLAPDIFDLEVYNTDVWVASFPKTGTTWTQEMTWMIANNLDFEGAKENLGVRFPFLELSSIFDYREVMKVHKDFDPPSFLEDSVTFVRRLKSPRYIKTHLPWNLLPTQIQDGTKKPKIIYVARNPKDTCLSYFHHCRLIEGYRGNFDDFSKLFLAGKVTFGPFWKNLISFWEHRHEPNICFIKYEDMRKDLDGAIRKVASFLEKQLSEEDVDKLKAHLSFESMKNNRSVNYETLVELNSKFKLVDGEGSFMRSGSVGGYKQAMSPELIEKFDKWTVENTAGTGFSFDT